MTSEHPFAQFVRILGKGPNLSRPLAFDEARAAGRAIMDGSVEPVQLGAFLCLLRVKTEIPEEIAGLAAAARESLTLPAGSPPVDLDWPSYAGKARQPPFYLLAALLLAGAGMRIFMHGAEHHSEDRVFLSQALAALGLKAAADPAGAAEGLARANFAYLPVGRLHPRFDELFALRKVLGVRSPFHTVVRHLNPFGAGCALLSVAHPAYRPIHVGAARLLGVQRMAVFKGEGGEAERRPEKPCEMLGLADGEAFDENWPALAGLTGPAPVGRIELGRLGRLWRGEDEDPYAAAIVIATAALALKAMGRAATQDGALQEAARLWSARSPTFT